jgi:hypothetical protein
MSKSKSEKNNKERNRNLCELDDFCSDHGLEKEFINGNYQVRVSKNDSSIDFYPTSRKYCVMFDHGKRYVKWGVYLKLEDLLKYFK